MSFILQTAAQIGCDLTNSVVPRSAGGESKLPSKAAKGVTSLSEFIERECNSILFGSRVSAPPLTKPDFQRAVESIASYSKRSVGVHVPKNIVFQRPNGVYEAKEIRDLSAQDWVWTGRYEIVERYPSTHTAMVKTPVGSYRMSETLLAAAPPPSAKP